MSFAPSTTYRDIGDNSILGVFRGKAGYAHLFEFSVNNTGMFPEYPHLIWVSSEEGPDEYRYGRVRKTVADIVIDEAVDSEGTPYLVIEKWQIKEARKYQFGAKELDE